VSEPTTPPGWYDDPDKPGLERYWDGRRWTEDTQPKAKQKPRPAPLPPGTEPLKVPSEKRSGGGRGCLLIILVLLVLWGVATCGNGSNGGNSPGTTRADVGDAVGAWVICQQFVEDRLTAPATADYPAGYSQYTTSLGAGRFRVDAYVDAENSFGALVRTDFTCTVNYQGNDSWRLESLVFDE